jgi:hypothetical protein
MLLFFKTCANRIYIYVQGDLEGKIDILGGDSIGHCEKKLHMNACVILSGYRDITFWICRCNSRRFLFFELDEGQSLQRKVDTRDELLARILDAPACIKKRDDTLWRKTRVRLTVGFSNTYYEL